MIKTIDDPALNSLRPFLSCYSYKVDSLHCYIGQIPNIAFILLQGRVYLKNKKTKILLPNKAIWGADYLVNNLASRYDVYIKEGSQILSLSRSDILKYKAILIPYIVNKIA